MNTPKVIIVHHSGGTDANPLADTSNQTFEIIRDYHISKGWGDIGYNWLIEKSGKICKGRDETIDGAHTIGMNSQSIGICLVGNFDLTVPTKEQEESLKIVCKDLVTRYPVLKDQIFPHRKYAQKSCYGKNLSDDWARLLVEEKKEEVIETPPPIVNQNNDMLKIATSWDAAKNVLNNSRVKSFLWRTGMMILAVIVNQGITFISSSGLNTQTIVILGLVLGEISKSLNNMLSGK